MRLKKFLMAACLVALPVLGASVADAQGTLRIGMRLRGILGFF